MASCPKALTDLIRDTRRATIEHSLFCAQKSFTEQRLRYQRCCDLEVGDAVGCEQLESGERIGTEELCVCDSVYSLFDYQFTSIVQDISQQRSHSVEIPKRTNIIIPLDNRKSVMDNTPVNSVWKEYRTDQVGTPASRDVCDFDSHGSGTKRNHSAVSQIHQFSHQKSG